MTTQFRCFHGHRLAARQEDRRTRQSVCPFCGAIAEPLDSAATEGPDEFAVTVVPVSMASPSPRAAIEDSREPASGDPSIDSTIPTADFDPTVLTDGGGDSRPADAARSRRPRKAALAPPSLPGYEIMDELGRGGMGVVYEAFDERHGRDVALKTLQRMGPDDIVRFKKEFRALSDIAHPNLASLYELLSDGRTWCFTMEILKGVEFLDYVWSEFDSLHLDGQPPAVAEIPSEGSRLTLRRINRLCESLKQLALGLHELHRADKLHSDIKPSNVLITTEGRLVLLDFGLIAEISKDKDGRVPKVIQGTPQYMSPEQAACAPLSGASDWYAVGVMLYEILTGRLPIRDKNLRIMLRKQYETPVEPIKRQPNIPPEWNELCMALLEIQPRNRPSAADVLRAVDANELARTIESSPAVSTVQAESLVGREGHLKALNHAFSEVLEGGSRSVFVHGCSGMGKSVLIRTFLGSVKRRREAIVLEGRCYEQESVPFKALDSLVDALVAFLGTLGAAEIQELAPRDTLPLTRLFPVLGQVFNVSQTPPDSIENADQLELRERALRALRELLTRLGKRRALVLYIDDLQWGDEDSSNLLADLMRPPEGPRALLLGSYRREDLETSPSLIVLAAAYQRGRQRPHRCELAVEPLSAEEATRLAAMLLGRTDRDAKRAAERIAVESGGSPFFVWELAQHVQDDSRAAETPLELDEVIWSRVRRLPEETRRLLEVFSVAGRPMRASEAYQAVDEVTHGPGLLAQLRTNNFIRTTEHEDDTLVETYHDRIRESVVNHLANAKVRGHHLRISLVIEQASNLSVADVQAHLRDTPDFAEPGDPFDLDPRQWQRVFDLAYFFDAAGKPDRAVPYALIAAEQARRQNAFDVAEQQFEIAFRGAAAVSDALRFRIAEGLGDVLMMRGRYDQANQQFQTARSLAKEKATQARIDGKRGYLCFKKGEMEDAAKHFERALTELGNPPPTRRVTQLMALLKEAGIQLLHTLFAGWLTGRRRADTKRCRMDLFRARLHDGLGYPYWFTQGPIPTLWTHLRHMNLAERYPPSQELGRAWAFHGVIATAIPLSARGAAYAARSYEIHGDLGDRLGQGKARSFQTFALLAMGRFRDAVEAGREAVPLLEQAGDVWEANMARIIVSHALYFLGDLRNCHREAKRAYEIGLETGDYSAIAIALYFWAPSAPERLPEGALQRERDRQREDPLSHAAAILGRGLELLLRDDQPAEAAAVIQESLDVARRLGIRNPAIYCGLSWKATALRVVAAREAAGGARRAALARASKAVRAALRITKKYPACRARALREAAELAALQGRAAQARRRFASSLNVAEQQEAAYEHALTAEACGAAGLRFGWPGAEEQREAATAAIARLRDFGDE